MSASCTGRDSVFTYFLLNMNHSCFFFVKTCNFFMKDPEILTDLNSNLDSKNVYICIHFVYKKCIQKMYTFFIIFLSFSLYAS